MRGWSPGRRSRQDANTIDESGTEDLDGLESPAFRQRGAAGHVGQDLDHLLSWLKPENTEIEMAADTGSAAADRNQGELDSSNEESVDVTTLERSIELLLEIDGATGAAIVDHSSGMALARGGNPSFDLEVAAAGNSNVVRAKLATMRDLGITDSVDDILITLTTQYHLINVLNTDASRGLFIYLALNKSTANLALARHKLNSIANDLHV